VVNRRNDQGIASTPNHLSDVGRNEIISTYRDRAMCFDCPYWQDSSVSDFGNNFGKSHPAVILHVVKLEILYCLL
jgi:hypothetical protein